MKVAVVWATRSVQDIVELELPAEATVRDAVDRSGLVRQYGIDESAVEYAIHGRRCPATTPLAEGDRVELTRPLDVDPKRVRAARAQREKQSRMAAEPAARAKPGTRRSGKDEGK
jgi:putative ubiquitin-RnfH superfamily antitoxin RatB of RatAB toxin-antitoxin module